MGKKWSDILIECEKYLSEMEKFLNQDIINVEYGLFGQPEYNWWKSIIKDYSQHKKIYSELSASDNLHIKDAYEIIMGFAQHRKFMQIFIPPKYSGKINIFYTLIAKYFIDNFENTDILFNSEIFEHEYISIFFKKTIELIKNDLQINTFEIESFEIQINIKKQSDIENLRQDIVQIKKELESTIKEKNKTKQEIEELNIEIAKISNFIKTSKEKYNGKNVDLSYIHDMINLLLDNKWVKFILINIKHGGKLFSNGKKLLSNIIKKDEKKLILPPFEASEEIDLNKK